jgi:hypothetical protein
VYTERVPAHGTLDPITPKSIVKPLPITELHREREGAEAPTGSGGAASAPSSPSATRAGEADPFAKLVPLAVLEEASVYTAQRDTVLRDLSEMAETRRQLADGELHSMDLPDLP